ncbi:hypothetical protein OG976_18625 [Mycobacterium sp. NBC_00419]|uniref:hypothetical protein n=1 Tax=Mycobacterium sp. NBC_00419 TaxID=2975989 RepID=UPI002E1ABD4A
MTFDVAGRLDRGRPAVADVQTYVTACHMLGYSHSDLTTHGAQVLQWYGAEDGLDLDVLDTDCVALSAMADAADRALRLQHDGLRALAEAWSGASGSVAALFVERHCQSGATVAGALRTAADSCAQLRDTVLRVVDEKVHATTVIDDRRAGQRPVWLGAAQTVMSAAPDRTEAVDVVVHQITPYVEADIRTEWVAAMRAATTAVESAYADVIRQVMSCGPVAFAVPDQLFATPPQPAQWAAGPATAPLTVPAATQSPPPPAVLNSPAASPAAANPALPAPEIPMPQTLPPPTPVDPLGSGPAMPGPAMPAAGDVGGGLTGLGGQIADAISALLASASDLPADTPVSDAEAVGELGDTDSPPEADAATPEPQADPVGADADGQENDLSDDGTETGDVTTTEPVEDSVTEQTTPAPSPPLDPPPPVVQPDAEAQDERSPCEIAADELPQVGQ